ncbi:hypothetical protein [Candidatus Hecatella orcuttiae]|uniref:hypothetical protein n=1 Tax=Candidatus Hecatella orcuttiae TaxID=1935119 RepID=UPI0028680F00|nr:hypothetical protein [Candidatus Hecatella orcuttiae]
MVAAIEHAKSTDESVRSLAAEFSLAVAYVIEDLPAALREQYRSGRVFIYIELNGGTVTHFSVGTGLPEGRKPNFTVISSYATTKKIFLGEMTPASAFVRRQVKVRPLMQMYKNPAFTAKSLTTVNVLLQIMKNVPTHFVE